MNDICQCGIDSSNLLSMEYYSFSCPEDHPNEVNFSGYMYSNSRVADTAYLTDIYYQWVNGTNPVDVFGDILYTNQCDMDSSSIIGVTVGVTIAFIVILICFVFCLGACCYCFLKKRNPCGKLAPKPRESHGQSILLFLYIHTHPFLSLLVSGLVFLFLYTSFFLLLFHTVT